MAIPSYPSLFFIFLGDLEKFEPVKSTSDSVRLVRPCFTINADPEDKYFGRKRPLPHPTHTRIYLKAFPVNKKRNSADINFSTDRYDASNF